MTPQEELRRVMLQSSIDVANAMFAVEEGFRRLGRDLINASRLSELVDKWIRENETQKQRTKRLIKEVCAKQ